ncbi:Ankyrin repeat domain-containing protein 20A3 [Leucoagaricus sp. SymC.cos]|nr:Ankyrin repeat domain-containing protein 20A3 [Leucoagaricus sp. SymC.cos]
MLTGSVLEDQPVNPPHAFCPWLSGRDREWGVMGESTFAEIRKIQGTIDEYLVIRNDNVPLIRSVQANDINDVRRSLELGADVDAAGLEGETVLHMASALGKVEIVRLLCEFHANVSALTEEHSTPLLHCARFCGSPDDALRVANILLDHGANPTKGIEECTPLYYALWRPLIPLAERLIPLTDLSKRAVGNFNSNLSAALDAMRHRQRIDPLNLLLQHASRYLHERDIFDCVEKGGLLALDAVLLTQPPIIGPSQSTWLHDHAVQIAFATLTSPRVYRRPSSQTISVLDRTCQYGFSPSDLLQQICEYEDREVLRWAIEKGAKLTMYSRGDLAEMIRYLPTDWQQTVLQAWDSQHSHGAAE